MPEENVIYTVKYALLPFQMPDFIPVSGPPVRKQDGFNPDHQGIPVRELTEKDALQYAELLRTTFMKHWASSQEGR